MNVETCPTCHRRLRRSNPQNARLWLLYHVLSEKLPMRGETYSADSWHCWAKSKFLGCTETKLPNGKIIILPNSTADLDVAEFNDYMTRLEAWANEHGVWLDEEME
jgi:hypothetical protein